MPAFLASNNLVMPAELGARGRRWFSSESFWNTPLPAETDADFRSDQWISLLRETHDAMPGREGAGPHINLRSWTLPVYHVAPGTPRRPVRPKLLECRLSQGHVLASRPYLHETHPLGIHESVRALGGVPIPEGAISDPEDDAHLVIVSAHENLIYDLWQCRRDEDGGWSSNAAICYPLDGPGVFTPETIAGIHNHESVHFYGPCRASGVSAAAGLIRRDEIEAGVIRHKLAFACAVAGLQEHVFPAIWTDGWRPGGLPEGCVLRLDPALDLSAFNLSPAARMIARALQEYGAVLVDVAGGCTLYGEWLGPEGKSGWDGLLRDDALFGLPWSLFHITRCPEAVRLGSHPVYHHHMAHTFYDHVKRHGLS